MNEDQINAKLECLDGWKVVKAGTIPKLSKTYRFPNFAEALQFTNKVGALAEANDHHPEIHTQWGRVTVTWWTHTAKGLTANDFSMAEKVDQLLD